ncbi:VOC family protein [Nostoc sp. NIES-2111]
MKTLDVYMVFPGTCREALDFYSHALEGKAVTVQTFGETPGFGHMPPERIMYSVFEAEGVRFLASDGMDPTAIPPIGGNITLTLNFTDVPTLESTFSRLADGGKILMPVQDTFWGSRFGMCQDRFGAIWMVNCEGVAKG